MAIGVLMGFSVTASAEDGLKSVFVAPPSQLEGNVEDDIVSDLGFFLSREYQLPGWKSFHQLHERVRLEVVNPDYERRTGEDAPATGVFEIDFINITGGKSPNLFVMSRLPGDCRPDGCLYQVYRLAYDEWIKMYEGHSRSLVYKIDGLKRPQLVKVGDVENESQMLHWTGYGFSED